VKLLRVIQEKSVRPVGAAAEVPLDVRILSATHKNLARLVEEGRFRHDLYYRINVIELPVPPLRDRRDDIAPIASSILARHAAGPGNESISISDAALDVLLKYPFPGNVRELENILERAVAMCEGGTIQPDDLGFQAAGSLPAAPEASPAGPTPPSEEWELEAALPDALLHLERERIRKALEACRYNKTRTAAHLGITFRALRYKLKKLGIE
jgi:two-component system response regulator PilR (NtrC family)